MKLEDIKEYRENAIEILRKHSQYATAKAVEEAFMALTCIEQYMWERDVALEQLNKLGIGLGEKVDNIKKAVDKNDIQDAIYKNGIFVCPNCEAATFPLSLYNGDYCIKCGQHIRWRGVIKQK